MRAGWKFLTARAPHPDSRFARSTLPFQGKDGARGYDLNLLHNIDGPPQQRHRGLQRAEGGVRGQRHVRQLRQRMIGLQRLGVEHIESGVADVAAGERGDQRGFVHQRAARGIDQDDARLHAGDAFGGQKAARFVVEREVHRYHIGARQQGVEIGERHAGAARAIPADHFHAHAFADACDFAADAAEPDHAQGLAQQLHAFVRGPHAAAHLAVHARDVARGRHHQCNGMLGHRGIAVAFDDVHCDAARLQFADIHVARRTGAEEHDVLEFRALRHQRRRHVGMVVNGDVIAADHARQFLARERLAVNVDFRIVWADHARPHRR